MTGEWTGAGTAALLGAVQWWLPLWNGESLFFSVTVAQGFRRTPPARAILSRYRLWVVAITAVSAGLALTSGGSGWIAIQLLGWAAAYAEAHGRMSAYGVRARQIREASLFGREKSMWENPWAWAGPLLLALAAAIYAFGGATANGWSTFTARWSELEALGVDRALSMMLGPMLGGLFCVFVIPSTPRRTGPDLRGILLRMGVLMAATGSLTAAAALGIAGSGMTAPEWLGSASTILIAAIAIVHGIQAVICQIRAKAPEGNPDATPDGTPDDRWYGGLIYYNPADPALMVSKRVGVGYTFNFARPSAWIILGLILAFALGARLAAR